MVKIDQKPKTDDKRIADISNAKGSKRIAEVVWKERRLFCPKKSFDESFLPRIEKGFQTDGTDGKRIAKSLQREVQKDVEMINHQLVFFFDPILLLSVMGLRLRVTSGAMYKATPLLARPFMHFF